jgi:signal transduction histidine kinase/ActR/RegA family two-component response regulator
MKKKLFSFSIKSTRFQIWKQIILAVLLIISIAFLYDGYKKTRLSALESYSEQQMKYAGQIINEVRFRFELIGNVLELWKNSDEILYMSEGIQPFMERILAAHGSYISGVTRMDENGIIRYTVPFFEGAIGADISGQEHIVELMDTHLAVLSDAFLSVQGYWAVVYHVPCFDNKGSFKGSLAFLVPFREMFRQLFMQLLPERETIPIVLDSDGRILFSPNAEDEGILYSEVFRAGSGEMRVADSAFAGNDGYMLTDFESYIEDADHPEYMLSTIVPFSFQGNTWFLILSVRESTVMQNISGLSNRWLGGMLAIILLALIYSTLKVRVWIASKEEKKWHDIAHLKDVLIRTVNQAAEIILILDSKERIIYANKAAVKVSGFGKKYLYTKIYKVPFQNFEPSIIDIRNHVLQSGTWSGRLKSTGSKAQKLVLDLTVTSVKDNNASIANYIIIARDVAVQNEMERRLLQQQKMEAIGQLAGGIAHDFNNLLVGVLGYAELMKERYPSESDVSKAADVIIAAVHQGSELTRQLLGYARKGKHQISRVDVGQCVRNVNELLKRTLEQRIEVVLDLEDGIFVKGDATQIEQVVLNLSVNARDAMPEGGVLKFTLSRQTVPGEIISRQPEAEPLELAVLKTSDTGSGIPDEHLDRIFEPFFTTKNEEGTGMGLATVYGIVVNHGGWVDVDSQPGKGTVFSVFLPLYGSDDTLEVLETGLSEEVSKGHGKTVMIVDDEEFVLKTLTELMTEIGYNVAAVSSGKKAIELLSEDPDRFDVVLLDLSMPEMDGKECFIKLQKIDPGIKVILTTGFSKDGRVQELLDLGVRDFLQKPFRLKKLAEALADLIEG